jgi:hypothetical protein
VLSNEFVIVAWPMSHGSLGPKSTNAASVSDRQTPHLNRCLWRASFFGEQHELSCRQRHVGATSKSAVS